MKPNPSMSTIPMSRFMPHRQQKRSIMSKHASRRRQQRSIPQAVIDGLIDFGERRLAGAGREEVYFTKGAWREFASYLGTTAKAFERYRNCYVIQANDGTVVTASFRH
jgi:hypothetical protein